MNEVKICTVFGTRPEAIKLAPVIRCLDDQPLVRQRVLVTGQHDELLHSVLRLFEIKPSRNLEVMTPDQTLSALTARIVVGIEDELKADRPDWIIVQGDTTTAFAAALVAFYLRIPVAHVEAGLRTDSIDNPFPEEVNRRIIAQLAGLHFAPTEQARENLLREHVARETVHVTGNTGIDALLDVASRTDAKVLDVRIDPAARLLLVTAHRRESFGQDLRNICAALRGLVDRNADVHVLYALHPNPNVADPVRREIGGHPRITLTAALDYGSFIQAMKRSFLILTDSGGIQEEAPSLSKPVLVLRTKSERVEALSMGTARLVGTTAERIVTETERLLNDEAEYRRMASVKNPYGDGHAAERIVEILLARAKA